MKRLEELESFLRIQNYNDLCSVMSAGFDGVYYKEFYERIFKKNIQTKGIMYDGLGNPMMNAIRYLKGSEKEKKFTKKSLVLRDFSSLDLFVESSYFVVISLCSYVGKRKDIRKAVSCHAIAIDIDYLDYKTLHNVLILCNTHQYCPKPTFLVLSGGGCHLYWIFKEPIWLNQNNIKTLNAIKKSLISVFWNSKTTGNRAIQQNTIFQSFRAVDTRVKFSSSIFTKAFDIGGDEVEPSDFEKCAFLMKFAKKQGYDNFTIKQRVPFCELSPETQERLSNPKPKERKSQPNEQNIARIQKRYYWWLEKIKTEPPLVGCRYYRCLALSAFAKKSYISKQQLESDLLSLVPIFDNHFEPFTQNDALNALKAYDDFKGLGKLTRQHISELTNIEIAKKQKSKNSRSENMILVNFRKKRQLAKVRDLAQQYFLTTSEPNRFDFEKITGLKKSSYYNFRKEFLNERPKNTRPRAKRIQGSK